MTRRFWVLVHRFAGLAIALVLVVAGLTGSILAFDNEINACWNPERTRVPVQDRPMLDPFTLRERALALVPHSRINFMLLNPSPGEVACFLPDPATNPATGKPYDIGCVMIFLNPYTGEEISRDRNFDDWPVTRQNFTRFVYSFHASMRLGSVGGVAFGIAALVWTLDCFVGLFLTFPRAEAGRDGETPPKRRSWWARWRASWHFVWRGQPYRIHFNLHRAAALWTWVLLLIFAISSVSFNLPSVYKPVMKRVFGMADVADQLPPDLPHPLLDPSRSWRDAAAIGQRLAEEQARLHGFHLKAAFGATYFSYDPAKGLFSYGAHGDRDVGYHTPAVTVYFDDKAGLFRAASFASGENAAGTFTSWIGAIHGASVGGLPEQIVVCLTGLVIEMLCVTGVYLWWKKRSTAAAIKSTVRPSLPC